MLILGSSSLSNIALSKSRSLHVNKSSSHKNIGTVTSNGGRSSSGAASGLSMISNYSSAGSALYSAPPLSTSSNGGASYNNKVVMIGFDDGWKSQITYAKPILDKYGFKTSFFIVCNYANSGDTKRMNWQDVAALQHDGMDIQSHTMDHKALNQLSTNDLVYEIAGSKQCLANHGIDSSIFAYPFNLGSNMPSVVDIVSKYYNLARTGTYPLMSLNCNGFANMKPQQADCRTYLPDGKLTFANRYDIRSDSFFHISSGHNYSPSEMYQKFIQQVNSQLPYNSNGKVNVIPIITYHALTYSTQDYNNAGTTITVSLFDREMQYLYNNGFKVLPLNQLGFDPTSNIFYFKSVPSSSATISSAATLIQNQSSTTSSSTSLH